MELSTYFRINASETGQVWKFEKRYVCKEALSTLDLSEEGFCDVILCWLLHPMQFERTLIVAEEGSYVSYLEGCTAPAYDSNQLHAAVVELSAAKDSEIKYSTVQNW